MIWQIWYSVGRVEVGVFASTANIHCLLFFSTTDCSEPTGMDVFVHLLPNTLLYAYSSVERILSVLEGPPAGAFLDLDR